MSIGIILNYVAWALCAVFAFLIVSDLVKVERGNRKQNEEEKEKN